MKQLSVLLLAIFFPLFAFSQEIDNVENELDQLRNQVKTLKTTELIQSMSQRSILTPSYFSTKKALVARQAYNLWAVNPGNRLVSHLNVYQALYHANKFLGYDSVNLKSYNQALGHDESVISLKYGSDPNVFYSAGSDGKVIRWRLDEGFNSPEVIYDGNHLIKSLDLSHDDKWILIVTKDQGIIILDNKPSEQEGQSTIVRDPELVQTAVFMPGNDQIAVVTKKGELKFKGYGKERTMGHTQRKVTSMTVNSSNEDVLLGTADGTVQVWEDTLAHQVYFAESFAVNTMAISSDFKTLALGREKGDVVLWDLRTKSLIRTISGHQSAITDVGFNSDNSLLLSASRDATVRVWEVNDSKKLPLVLDDHNDWVMTACFSPDSKRIISGSRDNSIRFWPVEHKELADRICQLVERNLTEDEWKEYVGESVPYAQTCPLTQTN
ncbi:MAG: hypothetical protein RIC35_14360 [Marinoscillum sp.]